MRAGQPRTQNRSVDRRQETNRTRRGARVRLGSALLSLALAVAWSLGAPPLDTGAGATEADDLATAPATLGRTAALDPAGLRAMALARGFAPLPPVPPVRPALVALGRSLAFDKVLSGNRDISCMTCHHPSLGTGDGRRLSVGTGGVGLGPQREAGTGPGRGLTIGRNSPPLYNLHGLEALFLDGRVARVDGDYLTPAGERLGEEMRAAFEFGALSALPLFPVLERDEMRGYGGNELSALPADRPEQIWGALMTRLGGIAEYRAMFEAAYPGTPFEEMTFAHASNAIAGFIVAEFTLVDTPWDRFLAGDLAAMNPSQLRGAARFLDLACSECHSGPALSDGEFHNVALAQFGSGLGDGETGTDDYGRYRVTGAPDDRYAFRTPGLRNVELTGPYGHAGQFTELDDFIAHYSRSAEALRAFGSDLDDEHAATLLDNADAVIATRDPLLEGVEFDETVVADLVAFMSALTDVSALDLSHTVPAAVPSGLPVAETDRGRTGGTRPP